MRAARRLSSLRCALAHRWVRDRVLACFDPAGETTLGNIGKVATVYFNGMVYIGTADANGVVNMAVFATPHVIDEETLAWGFTEGRSLANLKQNPHASYLYMAPSRGYSGWRLALTLKVATGEGELLAKIKEGASQVAGTQAGTAVKQVVYFKVDEVRPLM